MSARDSAGPAGPGNSGAGGLGNGGVGGGWGGGGGGVGAGRNGGAGSQTGMRTGTEWHGNTAYGRPGGAVQAYGMRDARSLGQAGMGPTAGSYGNFKTPSGQAMFGGSPVQGQSFRGMGMGQALSQANRAQQSWQQSQRPASVPGLLGGAPTPASMPGAYTPQLPGMWTPPQAPPEAPLPDEVIPGFDETYTPPAQVDLPAPTVAAPGTVTQSYRTVGGWPGQNTYYGRGQVGKVFDTDRVPQDSGRMTQSDSTTTTKRR
jgi:hypothetical protein